MKLCTCLLALSLTTRRAPRAGAFSPAMPSSAVAPHFPPPLLSLRLADADTAAAARESPAPAAAVPPPRDTRTLGLLTFDLDDSLYPIAPVLHDANEAFVRIMRDHGYETLAPDDIIAAGKAIRLEAGPVAGAALSHTEVRLGAIRREMERVLRERKLRECADDWATEVESLAGPVRQSAARWAQAAVAPAVVESVYAAWERERHHSAERHLYPEALAALREIRARHPAAIVGAVTDGKANPLLMVFTLAPHFDFCMSWEDDASGRTAFFKELGDADGNADLQWIYAAARERYEEIAAARRGMRRSPERATAAGEAHDDGAAPLWIHVGDDLAYDVGGSAACGARTVLLDLADEYGQTAKGRFRDAGEERLPTWSTALGGATRRAMNDAAAEKVDKRVSRLSTLPDAVDDILRGE